MGRITVTVEWTVFYLISSLLMGGLLVAAIGDEAHRSKWVDATLLLLFIVGLGVVLWQGAAGNLPGTGASARGFFPFMARFLAWSVGLGLLAGGIFAVIGYICVGGDWSNRDFAIGMILLPGIAGSMIGFLVGAVIAIVKARH